MATDFQMSDSTVNKPYQLKCIKCFAVLLIIVPTAIAMWALVPLKELLEKTDVIVVARLTEVRHTTKPSWFTSVLRNQRRIDYGSGTLTVTEVIRGSAKMGDKLRLEWSNDSRLICPRVEHGFHKDQTMIWLLQTSTNATVRADYPGRVLDLKSRGELDALIDKK